MRRAIIAAFAATILIVLPGVAGAQRTGGSGGSGGGGAVVDTVPRSSLPPAGMCRVWIAGVKPAQQSAVTDCATAVRNVPPNGRVIWGDTSTKTKAPTGPIGTKVPPPGSTSNPVKTVPPPPVKPPPKTDTLQLHLAW